MEEPWHSQLNGSEPEDGVSSSSDSLRSGRDGLTASSSGDSRSYDEYYDQVEQIAGLFHQDIELPWELLDDQKIREISEDFSENLDPELAELAGSLRNLTLFNMVNRLSEGDQEVDFLFEEMTYFEKGDSQRPLFGKRYELCEIIGRGSFGVVYRAFDRNTQREVALKFPRPELKTLKTVRDKFYIEGTSVSNVVHPGLVPLLDLGFEENTPYLVSRLVNGPNLEQWLDQSQRPINRRLAAQWIKQLADAIDHLHSHEILHGDLKPSNILLEHPYSDEPSEMPPELLSIRVTDFGSASYMKSQGNPDARNLQGTLCFMAPEQLDPSCQPDKRADIYAVCAIFYELLTDQPLWNESSIDGLRDAILNRQPVRPRDIDSNIPYPIEAIVLKGLSKRPQDRYESAKSLAMDLDAWMNLQTPQVLINNPLIRVQLWMRRNWIEVSVAVLLLAIGFSLSVWRLGEIRLEEQLRLDRSRQQWWNRYVDSMVLGHKLLRINALERIPEILEQTSKWPAELKVDSDPRGFNWFHLRHENQSASRLVSGMPENVSHYVMAVSGKTQTVFVGGADGFIREVDPQKAEVIREIEVHDKAIDGLAISPDGNLLAIADEIGEIRLFQLPDLELIIHEKKHTSEISDLKFSSNSQKLISSSRDGTLNVWNIETQGNQRVYLKSISNPLQANELFAMAMLPDPELVAVGAMDGTVRVLNINTGNEQHILHGHYEKLDGVVLSSDQKWLVSIARDRSICCWDLSTYTLGNRINLLIPSQDRLLNSEMGRQVDIFSQLIHIPELNSIAVDTGFGTIDLFHIPSGIRMGVLRGHQRPVWTMAYLPWSNQVASFARDRTMRVWDAPLTDHRIGEFTHFQLLPDRHGLEVPVLWDRRIAGSAKPAYEDGVLHLPSPFEKYEFVVDTVLFNGNKDWVFFSNDLNEIKKRKLLNRLEWYPGQTVETVADLSWLNQRKVLFEKPIAIPRNQTALQGHPRRPLMTFLAGDGTLHLLDISDLDHPEVTQLGEAINGSLMLRNQPKILVFQSGQASPRVYDFLKKEWSEDWGIDDNPTDWLVASQSPDEQTLAV
ncbi:MAG: Serine/threonine-protein kinase PrkC, partial [Planctomycetota bacterium]